MKPRKSVTKQTRNPEKTRAKLLQAGKDLFSMKGYSGVAVDDIVATAGCNKRMLYHYFENKDGLYLAVLRDVFAKLEAIEEDFADEAEDPRRSLRNLIERYFQFLRDNSDFTRLLMWENLNQGKCFAEHPGLLSKSPVLRRLDRIIAKANPSSRNSFAGDARRLLIAIIGLCFVPFSNCHTLRHTIDVDFTQSAEMKRHLAFVQETIEKLLFAEDAGETDSDKTGYRQAESSDTLMDEPENFWELG
jgi:TetR/AcrR family transcriptional regulator